MLSKGIKQQELEFWASESMSHVLVVIAIELGIILLKSSAHQG